MHGGAHPPAVGLARKGQEVKPQPMDRCFGRTGCQGPFGSSEHALGAQFLLPGSQLVSRRPLSNFACQSPAPDASRDRHEASPGMEGSECYFLSEEYGIFPQLPGVLRSGVRASWVTESTNVGQSDPPLHSLGSFLLWLRAYPHTVSCDWQNLF